MSVSIVMPQLGLTMTEGKVSEWLKKPGEFVRKGEMLFIVSTDKTDMEVESLDEGTLAEIIVQPGNVVPVGTVIALLSRPGGEESVPTPTVGEVLIPTDQGKTDEPVAPAEVNNSSASVTAKPSENGVSASPRARKLARELGVDISLIAPSGGRDRIVEDDVRQLVGKAPTSSVQKLSSVSHPLPGEGASGLQIVVTDTGFPDADVEKAVLAALDAKVTVTHCRTEDEVIAAARESDALLVQWAPVSRRVIEQLTRCRVISRFGVGVDMIDLDAARDHGIRVANVPDYCVEEVAAHSLCFLLALGRKTFWEDRLMHQGIWNVVSTIGAVNRIHGQTLGLVGVGRIGRRFAQMAAPLGLRILGYDVNPPAEAGPVHFVDLETVLRESDFISFHCPLTKETQHLMNSDAFDKLKTGAFLINVSRGGVVDTAALVSALEQKKIAGAALDVFEQEPLPPDHPLLKMDNVILTPHIASYSAEAVLQLRRDTAQRVVDFFQGTLGTTLV